MFRRVVIVLREQCVHITGRGTICFPLVAGKVLAFCLTCKGQPLRSCVTMSKHSAGVVPSIKLQTLLACPLASDVVMDTPIGGTATKSTICHNFLEKLGLVHFPSPGRGRGVPSGRVARSASCKVDIFGPMLETE